MQLQLHFFLIIIAFILGIWANAFAELHRESGSEIWTHHLDETVRSSPALDTYDNIYIGTRKTSGKNYSGKLYRFESSFNPETDEATWIFSANDWIDSSPALGPDGTIYVGCWNNYLYAINSVNGEVIWSYETGSLIVASPAISAEGTVYVGSSDGILYAFDTQSMDFSNPQPTWVYFAGDELDSSPAIAPDGTIYFGCYNGIFYALNPDGTEHFTFSTDNIPEKQKRIVAAPCIDDQGNIYFGSANGLFYSLDNSGNLNWKFETEGPIDSSAIIDMQNNIIFSSDDGYLYALDTFGTEIWTEPVGPTTKSSPIIDNNGTIYITAFNEDNASQRVSLLFAFDTDENAQPSLRWAIPFSDDVFSSPTIDNNRQLILGSDEKAIHAIATDTILGNTYWPKFTNNAFNSGQTSPGVPPVLTEIQRIVVLRGETNSINFKLHASGTVPISYQWKQNGVPLEHADLRTIQAAPTTGLSAGHYDLVAFNSFGSYGPIRTTLVIAEEPELKKINEKEVLSFTYHRPATDDEIQYQVYQSIDLSNPNSWTLNESSNSHSTNVSDTILKVKTEVNLNNHESCFLQLRLSEKE